MGRRLLKYRICPTREYWARFARRAAVATAMLGLYYLCSWSTLTLWFRDSLGWVLESLGHELVWTEVESFPALQTIRDLHWYSRDCLYLDMFLLVTPFYWRRERSGLRNLLRLGAVGLGIAGVNFLRCLASLFFDIQGWTRFYYHDLPDYCLYYPMCVFLIVASAWPDRRHWWVPVDPPSARTSRSFPVT